MKVVVPLGQSVSEFRSGPCVVQQSNNHEENDIHEVDIDPNNSEHDCVDNDYEVEDSI